MHFCTRVLNRICEPFEDPIENVLILFTDEEQVRNQFFATGVRIRVSFPACKGIYTAGRDDAVRTENELIFTNAFQIAVGIRQIGGHQFGFVALPENADFDKEFFFQIPANVFRINMDVRFAQFLDNPCGLAGRLSFLFGADFSFFLRCCGPISRISNLAQLLSGDVQAFLSD